MAGSEIDPSMVSGYTLPFVIVVVYLTCLLFKRSINFVISDSSSAFISCVKLEEVASNVPLRPRLSVAMHVYYTLFTTLSFQNMPADANVLHTILWKLCTGSIL